MARMETDLRRRRHPVRRVVRVPPLREARALEPLALEPLSRRESLSAVEVPAVCMPRERALACFSDRARSRAGGSRCAPGPPSPPPGRLHRDPGKLISTLFNIT
jgi:hypothetical protein